MNIVNIQKSPISSSYYKLSAFKKYDLEILECFYRRENIEYAVYWYCEGNWEGSGKMLYKKDGMWCFYSLDHCSCYGPIDNFYSENHLRSKSLDNLYNWFSDELKKETKDLYEEAKKYEESTTNTHISEYSIQKILHEFLEEHNISIKDAIHPLLQGIINYKQLEDHAQVHTDLEKFIAVLDNCENNIDYTVYHENDHNDFSKNIGYSISVHIKEVTVVFFFNIENILEKIYTY